MDIHAYFQELDRLVELEHKEEQFRYEKEVRSATLEERKEKGVTWYPVVVNTTDFGAGGQLYVTLDRTKNIGAPHRISQGATVCLSSEDNTKEHSLNGVVVSLWDDRIKISFAQDELPDWVLDDRLSVNLMLDDITYKEVKHTIKYLSSLEKGAQYELVKVLLGAKAPSFNQRHHCFEVPELNDSQNQAMNNVLAAHDVAVVHGPPGTGKTTTLVETIGHVLKKESQVLVTAPSNQAVDLLALKLHQKGIKVVRIGNPARVSPELQQLTLDEQLSKESDYAQARKWRKDADEMKRMARQYKRQFGREEAEQRRLLKKEARALLDEAKKSERYLVDRVIGSSQVVLATLAGANHRVMEGKSFETVFIDEAAQATEPLSWIPVLKGSRVIFAGDHLQLPPTVLSMEAAKQGLSASLMEKVVVNQPSVSILLDTQYRMHEKIMSFSANEFYEGKLKADASVKGHTFFNDGDPLVWVDTAGSGWEEKQQVSSGSSFNEGEADLVLKLIEEQRGIHASINPKQVGVISPYKAQVYELRKVLRGFDPEFYNQVKIETIDSFQGQERDVILISLTRSNESGQIGFLKDLRRMNVAMTRARKKLVMVGDSATVGGHEFYQKLLDFVQEGGSYRSCWEFMEY